MDLIVCLAKKIDYDYKAKKLFETLYLNFILLNAKGPNMGLCEMLVKSMLFI